jgi:hypothetical protein
MDPKQHEEETSEQTSRGSALTLDAFLAAGLLLAGLAVAISAAPAQQRQVAAADMAEAQLQTDVQDILSVANSTGALEKTTTYWDDSAGQWVDSGSSGRYFKPPDGHPLETPLTNVLRRNNIAYNVAIIYQTPEGGTSTKRAFYQGTPGSHAVSAAYTVVLKDSTHLTGPDNSMTVNESSTFYAPDAFPDSSKYNIVQVRIIAWRL